MAISSKKTGKEQIVEKLLIENYEQYYRLAYSYVHNEADALDIVQEGGVQSNFEMRYVAGSFFCGDVDLSYHAE